MSAGDFCKKSGTVPPQAVAWLRLAMLALALATAYALAVVTLRLPAWSGDHREAFRIALVLHVELAVFCWLVLSLAAYWSRSLAGRAWRWTVWSAGLGLLIMAGSPLAGGVPVMADYFPWLAANLWFALGFFLISAGVLGLAVQRLGLHDDSGDVKGFGLRVAAMSLLSSALAGAITHLQGGSGGDVAWAAGHVLLFAHVMTMVTEWSVLASVPPRVMRQALVPQGLGVICLGFAPLWVAPGTTAFLDLYTASMAFLLMWAPLRVGVWVWQRRERLSPHARSLLVLGASLLLLGAVLGAVVGLGARGTTLTTAHYHAAVGAVVLSRMAGMYQLAGQWGIAAQWPLMRRQLVTYAAALVLLSGGLTLAAIDSAPRKTSAAELRVTGAWYRTGMAVAGTGSLLAVIGTAWFLINLRASPRTKRRFGSSEVILERTG